MAHALDLVATWITSTGVGAPMKTSVWLWPLCETLHFVGLALLSGAWEGFVFWLRTQFGVGSVSL